MLTEGFLLGGHVRHCQMTHGHRTGLEPVLLAATVPASAGDRVLEVGTGSGAALLCLAWRVAGITGLGIERDPELAALAASNIAANLFRSLTVQATSIEQFVCSEAFDHAMFNPPWHDHASTRSGDSAQELARRGEPRLIQHWIAAAARCLRHRGTITIVTATGLLPDTLSAFKQAGCGSAAILPLWPKPAVAAKLVLIRAVKTGRGACRVLPGLILHQPDGSYTPAAQAILRDGAVLPL